MEPETYYDSPEKLEASLAGVYDMLGGSAVYGQRMLYRMGVEADEGYYARETPETGPQVYNMTAGHADINSHWNNLYTGVTRANVLLANIDNNPEIAADVRERVRAEAMFLRGYYYFMLVQSFGGVPLLTEPTADVDDVDIPRATVREVYEQILSDMTAAEDKVRDIRSWGFSGRVSKSAVRGILARVCLHMAGYPLNDASKYAEARDWAKKVIDDAQANHSLNPDFSQIFINYAQDLYDISESIWEVEFRGNATDAYTETGGVGYLNGPRSTANNETIGEGYGGIRITTKLYRAYKEGDLRRDWTTTNFTYANNAASTKNFIASATEANLYNRTSGKYRREYELLTPKARTVTPQNFPLLRYSDVLLMYAEADNEVNNGPSQLAIDYVNEVRLRAWSTGIRSVAITDGGSGYTAAPAVSFTGGGIGAQATATVSGGRVTQVTLVRDPVTDFARGKGYTSAPTVVFTGGGGSGATATATIFQPEEALLSAQEVSSHADFRQVIQDERLRELAFETLRKADLIRWGIFVFEMNQIGNHISQYVPTAYWRQRYLNVWDKYLLWPIPAREMSLNNALVQNPHW